MMSRYEYLLDVSSGLCNDLFYGTSILLSLLTASEKFYQSEYLEGHQFLM